MHPDVECDITIMGYGTKQKYTRSSCYCMHSNVASLSQCMSCECCIKGQGKQVASISGALSFGPVRDLKEANHYQGCIMSMVA